MRVIILSLAVIILSVLSGCSDDIVVPEYDDNNYELQPRWDGFDNDSEYLVVLGDVQSYVDKSENFGYFRHSMEWVASQLCYEAPLRVMLFTGDMTDNNSSIQWRTFRNIASVAANRLLTVCCPGNHDYEWNRTNDNYSGIESRESCELSKYVNFDGLTEHIVDSYSSGSLDNIVVELSMESCRLYVVSIEFSPRHDVIRWASDYIGKHPDDNFLILTHEMLTESGKLIGAGSFGDIQFNESGIDHTTPVDVYEETIKPHGNVIGCICGHNGYSAYRMVKQDSGKECPIVLFNLQYQDNGGDGMLELWEFSKEKREVRVHIISTITGKVVDNPAGEIIFSY
ncbi:MAG: metallophosphoesterase [Prevotella sp.]|nr:metallophosphoesterase [Bacteroides sp.]MCM1366444.1 metallophosphoesterase [Prevotella sp.]MCM1437076.1 metallophosphoesterase [Prevotella sp.]